MLKTEFEDRFGKKVTDERYAIIERVYMATHLTKDEFVAEFKVIDKFYLCYLDFIGARKKKEFADARDLRQRLNSNKFISVNSL